MPELKAEGTSKLHEFIDIGRPGKVSTRRAACHQCDACWAGDRYNCANKAYTGLPFILTINRVTLPAAAAVRMERAELNRQGLERAKEVEVNTVVCIETHDDEQTHPWVIGKVVETLHNAAASSTPYNEQSDPVKLVSFQSNDPVLKVQLYEALEPASSVFFLSELTLLVSARRIRVVNVELEETRASARVAGARVRLKIEEDSLRKIRAAMPATNDKWVVEKVVQYRCQYGVEQWLVKWKDYGEDRNTWEPWDNFLNDEIRSEARAARTAALPHTEAALLKHAVVTLKAALLERGLDCSGQKVALVSRLLTALLSE